jgi:hypothetical protein
MKNTTSEHIAGEVLEPLIRYSEKHRGTYQKITQLLTDATGEVQHRQNVHQWLHPDPRERVEPRFGIGLMLLSIGHGFGLKPKLKVLARTPRRPAAKLST